MKKSLITLALIALLAPILSFAHIPGDLNFDGRVDGEDYDLSFHTGNDQDYYDVIAHFNQYESTSTPVFTSSTPVFSQGGTSINCVALNYQGLPSPCKTEIAEFIKLLK